MILALFAIEYVGKIAAILTGQRHGGGDRQGDPLVGRAEDQVVLYRRMLQGGRVEAPQLRQCRAGLNSPALKK